MSSNSGKTVEEILKSKKASIKNVPLDPGSPSWDDILHLRWEDIEEKAKKRDAGYQTIRKLLTNRRFRK
jgi:hypothetical protein